MSRYPKILSKSPKSIQSDKYELSQPLIVNENYDVKKSYDWRLHLDEIVCVPVEKYANAPLQSVFHHLRAGLKVEVPNKDYWTKSQAIGGIYWVAYVIKVVGYKALVRYEGYEENDDTADFWINLCSADLHPVGWCAGASKPLVPPSSIAQSQSDWKAFLVKRLTGARTLPHDFQEKVLRSLSECVFKEGMRLEMVDRVKGERLKVGLVEKVIANRLYIVPSSKDTPTTNDEVVEEEPPVDYWCCTGSPLIYPVGFACRTGYPILCTEQYKKHCDKIIASDPTATGIGPAYFDLDARPYMFNLVPRAVRHSERDAKEVGGGDESDDTFIPRDPGPNFQVDSVIEKNIAAAKSMLKWEVGMKLECLDPVEMNAFFVCTVSQILKGGFLRITLDGSEPDHFLFSHNSPYLFPAGFCDENNIEIEKIKDAKGPFKWEDYLTQTQSKAAPPSLFDDDTHLHNFDFGCKVEAVDSLEPKLVCVATVVDKKGSRLLKLRYDGWESNYDQWQDYRSPDIYPIGWCEMAGYQLEAPKDQVVVQQTAKRKLSSVVQSGNQKQSRESI